MTAVKRQRAELQVIALAGAAPGALWAIASAVSFAAEALVARTAMVQEVEADARGVRSRLALPLLVGGEGWGALVLESARKDAYDESEQRIAVDMARQAQRGLADVLIVGRLRDAGPNEAQWIADSYQNRASERRRLAEIAGRAGRALSMPAEEQRMLSVAAFLRDLGMAAGPGRRARQARALDRGGTRHADRPGDRRRAPCWRDCRTFAAPPGSSASPTSTGMAAAMPDGLERAGPAIPCHRASCTPAPSGWR